jgi:hypothetical protein
MPCGFFFRFVPWSLVRFLRRSLPGILDLVWISHRWILYLPRRGLVRIVIRLPRLGRASVILVLVALFLGIICRRTGGRPILICLHHNYIFPELNSGD